MGLAGRALIILVACLLAGVAAGAVLTFAALFPAASNLTVDAFAESIPGYLLAFGAIFLSPVALLLWILVIVLAEIYAIRLALFYATAGATVAALTYFHASRWSMLSLTADGFARRELEIMAAAGIIAGFVYWIVAGRKAGADRKAGAGRGLRES